MDSTEPSVPPTSRWMLTWARNCWRRDFQLGSDSRPRVTARFWILFNSESWYCGASATARPTLANSSHTTLTSPTAMIRAATM